MEDSYARVLWTVIEPVHIVTYFSPECIQANKDLGMKGQNRSSARSVE